MNTTTTRSFHYTVSNNGFIEAFECTPETLEDESGSCGRQFYNRAAALTLAIARATEAVNKPTSITGGDSLRKHLGELEHSSDALFYEIEARARHK